MTRDDEETARIRIRDRMKDQVKIREELGAKLANALKTSENRPTEQMRRDQIRTAAAAAVKEVLTRLHKEGRIELQLPPPIMVGDVVEAPKGSGKVEVCFHIHEGWLASLPDDVRQEILEIITGSRGGSC